MQPNHAFNQVAAIARDILQHHSEFAVASSSKWIELGYNVLGSGHYSVAISHPDKTRDTVLKIGRDIDDSWLAFAVYAMNNPSPIFPHILSIKLHSQFYIVEMEKLKELPYHVKRELEMQHGKSRYAVWDLWVRGLSKWEQDALYRMETVLGKPNDLHGGNVMYRDGQPVLIDPYADAAGNLPASVKKYMPARPEGMSERVALEVDSEFARNIAELATSSPDAKARAQEEVPALRVNPVDNPREHAQRMARLLPPMPRDFMVWADDLAQPRQFVRAEEVKRAFLQPFPAVRFPAILHLDRGPDIRQRSRVGGFDVAVEGRHNFPIAGAVHGRMVGQAFPRGVWDIREDDFRRLAIKEAVLARCDAKVPDTSPIPTELNIPLEDRARHLAPQHGRQQIQVRRGDRGGRTVCHKSRGVCAYSVAIGDQPQRRQVGCFNDVLVPRSSESWCMAGPGQGRAEGNELAGKRADFVRVDTVGVGFT